MKTKLHTENSELAFVILFDFSKASYHALNYLIKLAKVIEGTIDVFCINPPSEITNSDNHTVELTFIREEKERIERKLLSIVEMIELEGVSTSFSMSFGVDEGELEQKFNNDTSKIAVFPKIRPGFIGRATNYLTNNFSGSILIIGEYSEFNENLDIAIGYNQPIFSKKALLFPSNYCLKSNTTLRTFEFGNVLEGIQNYISTNELGFICISHTNKNTSILSKILGKNTSIDEVVNNINIPVFIMGNK